MKWLSGATCGGSAIFNKGLRELRCQLIHLAASPQMPGKVLYLRADFFLHITTLERAMRDVLTVVCTHTFGRKRILTVGFKIFSFQKNHRLSIEILESESKKHKESTSLLNSGTFLSVFFSFCFFSL